MIKNAKNWVIWSMLASVSSFLVVIFSFLLPSYQEQSDRARGQEVIESYEKVGDQFLAKGLYADAEKVFARAFEFSENKRLDIELKRLKARISKVYEKEDWVKTDIEELDEGDFLFLIETLKEKRERADVLGAYGIFKSLQGKKIEAQKLLEESLAVDPDNTVTEINLGNVYDDLGMKEKAKAAYLSAIEKEKDSASALYNLALLLDEGKECHLVRTYRDRLKALGKEKGLLEGIRNCR